MNYFLDTNICSYYLKGMYPQLVEHLKHVAPSQIKIASIVKAELFYGAYRSRQKEQILNKVQEFIFPFEVVNFDDPCVNTYAETQTKLEKQGTPIGPSDLIIAATVLANKSILITNNEKEFGRIPELKIENWTK